MSMRFEILLDFFFSSLVLFSKLIILHLKKIREKKTYFLKKFKKKEKMLVGPNIILCIISFRISTDSFKKDKW